MCEQKLLFDANRLFFRRKIEVALFAKNEFFFYQKIIYLGSMGSHSETKSELF